MYSPNFLMDLQSFQFMMLPFPDKEEEFAFLIKLNTMLLATFKRNKLIQEHFFSTLQKYFFGGFKNELDLK